MDHLTVDDIDRNLKALTSTRADLPPGTQRLELTFRIDYLLEQRHRLTKNTPLTSTNTQG